MEAPCNSRSYLQSKKLFECRLYECLFQCAMTGRCRAAVEVLEPYRANISTSTNYFSTISLLRKRMYTCGWFQLIQVDLLSSSAVIMYMLVLYKYSTAACILLSVYNTNPNKMQIYCNYKISRLFAFGFVAYLTTSCTTCLMAKSCIGSVVFTTANTTRTNRVTQRSWFGKSTMEN